MDNNSFAKLKEAIGKSANIGVVVGRDPSLDQMAAALSFYLLLKQANKQVSIAAPDVPLVEVSSLVGINRVQTSLGGQAGDLVVSFPYVEGEIEKVSYTLENGLLNIIVKAGEHGLSFEEQDVKYTRGSGQVDLLIVIGTQRLSDLGEIIAGDKLGDVKIVNIDNKQDNQGYGDVVLVSPQASSLSEQVADIVLSLGLPIDQDAAQNLMSGIMSATKNFQDPKTSPIAFEIAAVLMKRGAHRKAENAPSQEHREWAQSPAFTGQPVQQPSIANRGGVASPRTTVHDQFMDDPYDQQPNEQVAPVQSAPSNGTSASNEPDDEAPVDWLSPKVYKGSSNFSS